MEQEAAQLRVSGTRNNRNDLQARHRPAQQQITRPETMFEPGPLAAGSRLGLAVSGGADSVALLRLAWGMAESRGWRLRVLHVHHGLRAAEADADAQFVEQLAAQLGVPCEVLRADTGTLASEHRLGLEEAGRLVRYSWWKRLLLASELDAVATGHTLDDQAETVLGKVLRGAWTAGLAGIYPQVAARDLPEVTDTPAAGPDGTGWLVRPLLGTRRATLRAWLRDQKQPWREDATNDELRFTRNRIRHTVLPVLSEVNPQAAEHLAQISMLAREEEQYWQHELQRVLPGLLLPGRPVRGGGRANASTSKEKSLGFEVERLRTLPVALQRRVLRATAQQLGVNLSFAETERVTALLKGGSGSTTRREQINAALHIERTARELRFVLAMESPQGTQELVEIEVPGEGVGLGVRVRVHWSGSGPQSGLAVLRAARPADRVKLRHSSGAPKRVKEVLERMGVAPVDRAGWPVVEWRSEIAKSGQVAQIVWMHQAVLDPGDLVVTLIED